MDQVEAVADKRGLAQALRISDTEIFAKPVTRKQYNELLKSFAGPKQILAPARMPTPTFQAIYNLGRGQSDTVG